MTDLLDAQVYDIETAGWTTVVMVGAAGFPIAHGPVASEKLLARLIYSGKNWAAWNGGRYDAIAIADLGRRLNLRMKFVMSGSRISTLQFIDTGSIFYDYCALMPFSLAKAAELCGYKLSKDTGLPCICEQKCGGYCSIQPNMSPNYYNILEKYLIKDLKAPEIISKTMKKIGSDNNLIFGTTLGSTSYRTAFSLSESPLLDWAKFPAEYKFARSAYRGGRCEVFRRKANQGHAADLNSAYPWVLATLPIPIGQPQWKSRSNVGDIGIIGAEVIAPKMYIPFLPINYKGRLVFPTGSFSGVWTSEELNYAESIGYKIKRSTGIIFKETQKPYELFCSQLWEYRKNRGKKTFEGAMSKWLLVSLAGKLAARAELEELVHCKELPKPCEPKMYKHKRGKCPPNNCCYHRCLGNHESWGHVGMGFWTRKFFKIQKCAQPVHAAFMTAAVRIELHRQLTTVDNPVYCDTDGIKSVGKNYSNIGENLGQWALESSWKDFVAVGPKAASFIEIENNLEKKVVKAKGLSGINYAEFLKWAKGEKYVVDRGVNPIKRALRAKNADNLFQKKYITKYNRRANSIFVGSRIKIGRTDTRAIDIDEIEMLDKE